MSRKEFDELLNRAINPPICEICKKVKKVSVKIVATEDPNVKYPAMICEDCLNKLTEGKIRIDIIPDK